MKRTVFALAIAIMPLCGVVSCKGGDKATAAGDNAGGGKRGMRGGGEGGVAFAVDALEVKAQKLEYIVTAPGTIEAFERVQVTSRVAGIVDRVAFSEGQTVKKGDTLVVIDSERFRLSVNSARAALEKAQAAQKDVEGQVLRREGVMAKNPGLIPGEELESYRTKSLTAKADTAVAAENVKIAELNLRDSFVRATIDGVIQTRTVETGQYVQAGYVMATLLRENPMLLRFQVEPLEAPRLKPGMAVRFTMRETQREFSAKIKLTAGAADPTTHMVGITAEVDTTDHQYWLRPGSFCDVFVDVGATREASVIPRSATRATDRGYVAYVLDAEGDQAEERVLKLGMSTKDGWVEVRDGLKPGDWVVVRGAEALTPGARVRVTKVSSMDAGAPPLEEPGPPGGGGEGREGGAPRGDGGFRGDGGARKRKPDAPQ